MFWQDGWYISYFYLACSNRGFYARSLNWISDTLQFRYYQCGTVPINNFSSWYQYRRLPCNLCNTIEPYQRSSWEPGMVRFNSSHMHALWSLFDLYLFVYSKMTNQIKLSSCVLCPLFDLCLFAYSKRNQTDSGPVLILCFISALFYARCQVPQLVLSIYQ